MQALFQWLVCSPKKNPLRFVSIFKVSIKYYFTYKFIILILYKYNKAWIKIKYMGLDLVFDYFLFGLVLLFYKLWNPFFMHLHTYISMYIDIYGKFFLNIVVANS